MIGALLGRIAASPFGRAAMRYGAMALAVLVFLLAIRRAGERAGRIPERLKTMEKANDVQRRMLEAAKRRPRDRDELAERLRDGRFLPGARGGMPTGGGVQRRISVAGGERIGVAAGQLGDRRDDG